MTGRESLISALDRLAFKQTSTSRPVVYFDDVSDLLQRLEGQLPPSEMVALVPLPAWEKLVRVALESGDVRVMHQVRQTIPAVVVQPKAER